MNFLAHAVLSKLDEPLLLGNMVADMISKQQELIFPPTIQYGIRQHRFIDSFTDEHQEVRRSVALLRPNHKKYSPVVMDVLWDLMLAENWDTYIDIPIRSFITEVYSMLKANEAVFPDKLKGKFNFLIEKDFLFMYTNKVGMATILEKIEKSTAFPSNFSNAILDYEEHHSVFEDSFSVFFPELVTALEQEDSF